MGSTTPESPISFTAADRRAAAAKVQQAFKQPNGNVVFVYNGAVYQYLSTASDGTIKVKNITTGLPETLDPVLVLGGIDSTIITPPPQVINGPAGPSILQQAMDQIGTISSLINMLMQSAGKWAASAIKAAADQAIPLGTDGFSAAESGTGSASAVAKFLNFLNAPIFKEIMGAIGAGLSAYSTWTAAQSIYKGGITGSGALALGGGVFGIATGVNMLAGGAMFTNPVGWVVAAAVLSTAFTYAGINDWITNGPSVGSVATTLASAAGVYLTSCLLFFGFTPMGFIVAGIVTAVVVLFSALWSLFHQPPPEQRAIVNLNKALTPIIWTASPVVAVGAAAIALAMGWPRNHTPPITSGLTVPAYYVTQMLPQTYGSLSAKTPTIVISTDTVNGANEVVIVTPTGKTDPHGNATFTMNSYFLTKNMQIVSASQMPPQGSYIPFFAYDAGGHIMTSPSGEVMQALTTQDKMLQAALSGDLNTTSAQSAVNVAAAADKSGVSPAG